MAVVRANPSTQQTNAAMLAGQDKRSVAVHALYVSSDTEMTVTIVNSESHTILWRQYVGARGGVHFPAVFHSALGEGLDLTTSANGNVYVMVSYEWVGRGNRA